MLHEWMNGHYIFRGNIKPYIPSDNLVMDRCYNLTMQAPEGLKILYAQQGKQ